VTSFVLGIIFLLIANASISVGDAAQDISAAIENISPLTTVVLWLGSINIVLALFNLIPGFPLDGGRLLRASLWGITDDLRKATRWASWVGQGVAWLLIISGIAMIFGIQVPFFGTGFIGGLWLAFIGWFLNSAAIASYQRVVIKDLLEDVPVKDVMRQNPPTVTPEIPVESFVHEYVMQSDDYAFPVVDGESLVGLVTLTDVRAVDRENWPRLTVTDIMTPLNELVTTHPDDETEAALRTLMEHEFRQLPVVSNGLLRGLLRRRDVMKWLQLQSDIRDGSIPGRRALGQSA
jgi:CBS domain-containing protein